MTSYLVNRASTSERAMNVTLPDGSNVEARVAIFEVELVDETGQHGTITRRYQTPEERHMAADKYRAGEHIELDL